MEIPAIPAAGEGGPAVRKISPTDIAQFIRLDQCERFLRLRLFGRLDGMRFMRDYDVVPQSIPSLLTRSGAEFERRIEREVAERYWKINFVEDVAHGGDRPDDNERVVSTARELPHGEVVVLFQPRIDVELAGWRMRGDVDMLRLERDAAGELHILIADMKSTTAAKVEHRLQVAFYVQMIGALFEREGVSHRPIEMGILYRGPAGDADSADVGTAAVEREYDAVERYFGTREGRLEIVADGEGFAGAVADLVTGPDSAAARVARTPFDEVPFHLTYKCDGCMFNEFCMKWSAEHDDLSLLPHLTPEDKNALRRAGVTTTRELAHVKEPGPDGELVAPPAQAALVRRLSVTWPLGPRLDELVHRARRYRRFKGDDIAALSYIPSKGYGSLPYTDAGHNPNLVRVYIDAQHDYLHDRIYMLGSLVVACEGGQESPERRRAIVHLADRPPESLESEERLFVRWVEDTVRAVVELAAPDEEGQPRAPIHLIFYNRFEQRLLLDGLARHFTSILGATPLYDFVTQLAAYDSPVATFLDEEIRELKNYPMVCQSLQAVAAYLRFDWNAGVPYREIFRTRMFDFWRKLDWDPAEHEEIPWYTGRARFNSQIPLEYAYAAWGQLEPPRPGARDDLAPYRESTPELLAGFHARRLEALERIAHDFAGNRQTQKRSFDLPALSTFESRAETLAAALDEFVTIERHVTLAAWKTTRLAPPERRALAGETLVVRYCPEDQEEEVRGRNRENVRLHRLAEDRKAESPDGKLSKDAKKEVAWSQEGLRFRLRIETSELDCGLDEILGLTTLKAGDGIVVSPRFTVDSRLPPAEQLPFTPTPRQMLYSPRAAILGFTVERNADGRAVSAMCEVEMKGSRGGPWSRGFAFNSIDRPFEEGKVYTLDGDPNDWYGYFCATVVAELCANVGATGQSGNRLYEILSAPPTPGPFPRRAGEGGSQVETVGGNGASEGAGADGLPAAGVTSAFAAASQISTPLPGSRYTQGTPITSSPSPAPRGKGPGVGGAAFLAGLEAFQEAGLLHELEESKREYIGGHADAPLLLVQGPPGTGKSYSTAFAVFARLQAAMAEGRPFRVFLTCKTHAATNVLLENVIRVRDELRSWRERRPDLFDRYFDARLLDAPLFRGPSDGEPPDGVTKLYRKEDRPAGAPHSADLVAGETWGIIAITPGGTYRILKDRYNSLFGHPLCDCLVLDEASQMNIPEAILAALPLTPEGQVIVVGDHRQMPPIVKHDWDNERRRTFAQFHSYESLFLALLPLRPPMIKFAESFRLHADMAEFLRREIYGQDGIPYFSRQERLLPPAEHDDPFVAAVLRPEHTIVVVVHDEDGSLFRNELEGALIAPVLQALARPPYDLGPEHGLGVVVPHRAQRAALQEAVPQLNRIDPLTGTITLSAVDTVERFQGDERTAILVGATESDRDYLLLSSDFLLDPRRLTVALSRAKRKIVLVASRSVFSLFSADEETFAHAQLWKNLLRHTATVKLWEGQREGHRVEVWGSEPGRNADRRTLDGIQKDR